MSVLAFPLPNLPSINWRELIVHRRAIEGPILFLLPIPWEAMHAFSRCRCCLPIILHPPFPFFLSRPPTAAHSPPPPPPPKSRKKNQGQRPLVIQMSAPFLFHPLFFFLFFLPPLNFGQLDQQSEQNFSKCPTQCRHCSPDGRHADCQGMGLNRPPAPEEFDPRLEWLDLRRNGLVSVEADHFAGLERLHTLLLGHNRIRHLEKNLLDKMSQLQRLHLTRNHIRHIPQLVSISTPIHLQVLDLRGNQIRTVDANAFSNLMELRTLDLADNFLQNVPRGALDSVLGTRVELHGNPWNCDCRILPLLTFLASNNPIQHHQLRHFHHNPKPAKCMNPGRRRGTELQGLAIGDENPKCFSPIVADEFLGKETDRRRMRLQCDLNSPAEDDAPAMQLTADTVQWIYRDQPLESSTLGEFELLEDGSLLLGSVKADLGDLKCALNYPLSSARQSRNILEPNSADQAQVRAIVQPPVSPYQQPAHQQQQHHRHRGTHQRYRVESGRREEWDPSQQQQQPAGERGNREQRLRQQQAQQPSSQQSPIVSQHAPRFTYTPRDRRFREGTAVQLSCEATGEPKPLITWFFNSNPVESSRKHELRQEGTQLIIYPFLEQDIGAYACEAANAHGRVRSPDARLELIRSTPPVILEGPKAQNSRPGQRVTFRCTARGEPRPSIGWFFNGLEIATLGGHFQISDEGTELSIGQVSRQDAGTYSCMAGNPVGSMTAEAQLQVQSTQLEELDRRLSEQTLRNIVQQASQNIERAILKTKEELRAGVSSPQDLLRHFKFVGKQPTELTRAREIYEESLRLIEKHIELGLSLRPEEMPAQNISFESVLSVTHIQTLMELSGCMNGQFKDACQDMCHHSKYRSYTGQCNNFEHPTWGVSQMPFLRLLPPIYENGFNTPVGWDPQRLYFGFPKPNARAVSSELIGTDHVSPHPLYSAMLMQWGQFIDHDLDFTATALSRQTYIGGARCNRTCENLDPCFNIPLPANDPRRSQLGEDKLPCIEFERSAAICGSGETSPIFRQITYREQANIITSYLDASQIYGSTEVDAIDLRDLFSDHGLLRFDIVSAAQKPYLPFERDSAMDCRRNYSVENPIRCFLSGDFRANEQVGLTAMHTIWMREHNRIATKLLELNADWDGERIFQEARKIVGAQLQHITYKEWLPKVLGQDGYDTLIGPYTGYDPEVNPSVSNAFATAAFRFGHTLINPRLERLDKQFQPIPEGPLPLHEAFFAPERLLAEGGVDPLLRGLFASPLKQPMSEQLLNRELTERLFHRAHNVSLDLAALNIQRGRDHGIPGYLEYRRFCNLTVPDSWEQFSIDIPNPQVLTRLRQLYGHPGNIDLWVGGIVEKRLPDGLVGPTFSCLIADQFKRLRAGDRFWHENPGVFTPLQLTQIRKSTLAGALCRNGDDIDRVQPDVFLFVGHNQQQQQLGYRRCADLADLNVRMWMSCCEEDSCSSLPSSSRGANGGEETGGGGGGGKEGEEEERQKRRRRSQHLYHSSSSRHQVANAQDKKTLH